MLPKNNKVLFCIAILVMVLVVCKNSHAGSGNNPVFRFYERVISPIDGHRCPMHPSCSTYAVQAIEKHGIVIGWMMACDRLQRCGRDTVKMASQVTIDHEIHAHDPVEANDFWWFDKKGTD